jgi:peptidoglycan/xylan/chitin deacetylase (PgdA/CDA1 family)
VNRAAARLRVETALDRAGLLDRLFWLRARVGRRGLAVLTYHRTGAPKDAGELDPGVFDTTPEELATEVDILRTHATLVSLADVRRSFHGRRLPPNPVLVTFDDGYADVEAAVPVLRKAGVPATFFIVTGFPDGGRLFWWDRIWLLLRRSPRPRVELTYPTRLVVQPARALGASARAIIDAVKLTPDLDLTRFWDGLEEATGVALDAAEERALAARTLLGWSAIRRLRGAGMDVQSHSHEHLVLNALSPDAVQRDLTRSRRLLHDVLGEAPSSVAYPVGYQLSGVHRDAPSAAGFELGFTNGTGLCSPELADPFNVPRVSMDLGITVAAYKARLLLGDGRWARGPWTAASGEAAEATRPRDTLEPVSAEARGA